MAACGLSGSDRLGRVQQRMNHRFFSGAGNNERKPLNAREYRRRQADTLKPIRALRSNNQGTSAARYIARIEEGGRVPVCTKAKKSEGQGTASAEKGLQLLLVILRGFSEWQLAANTEDLRIRNACLMEKWSNMQIVALVVIGRNVAVVRKDNSYGRIYMPPLCRKQMKRRKRSGAAGNHDPGKRRIRTAQHLHECIAKMLRKSGLVVENVCPHRKN